MAEKDEEEERRSGAVILPGGAAGGGVPGWGGWLQTVARIMAVSPEAALLRILGGAVLGVACLTLATTLYGRAQPALGGPLAVRFDTRRPGEAPADSRPPMENFVRGMAGLWGPVLGLSDAPMADVGTAVGSVPAPDAPKAADAKGSADAKGKESEGNADASAREVDVAGGASGAGRPGAGALASADLVGGGAASAARVGAAVAPASSQDGAEGAGAPKRDMRAGALRSARPTAGKAGKGALNQLKFAQNRSALGASSVSPEKSFSTAQSAFEGGTPGAGSAIGGAGASQGGAGVGNGFSQPQWIDKGPVGDPSKRLSCPSGYSLDGSDCKPLEGVNKTPYQSLVDMAKAFLIIGAALALLGLLLVTRPVPWMQALGGILLGVAAGLIIAALAIGADIQSRYGQKSQKGAIDSAAGRAGKGTAP